MQANRGPDGRIEGSPLAQVCYVFYSHSFYDGSIRVGSHHLADHLAANPDNSVLHVSTPVSRLHAIISRQRKTPRYRASGDAGINARGVVHIVPRQYLPPKLHLSGRLGTPIRKLAERAHNVVILVDQPLFYSAATRLRNAIDDKAILVYRPTDMHPAGALARAEKRMLRIADAVIATSDSTLQSVLRHAPKRRNLPAFVLQNGVELAKFRPPTSYGEPRAGFIYAGAVDNRFDWLAVQVIANAFPDARVTIAGPVRTHVPNLPRNVSLLGVVPYEQLPQLLWTHQVGLLPFNESRMNAGRSPMKFYEYLTAGLAVAGTRTPELAGRQAPLTWLWNSHEAAAECARTAVLAEVDESGIRHAAEFDWGARTSRLVEIIDSLREMAKNRSS